jgi:hypothetical protein
MYSMVFETKQKGTKIMGKFKLKFKIKELEFEMEGERESIPVMTHALQHHFTGLLKPAQIANDSASPAGSAHPAIEVAPPGNGDDARRSPKPSSRAREKEPTKAFDFRHDPSKWGSPKQSWTAGQKIIWLLYVILQQSGKQALTAGMIASTFNKHFREAGMLKPKNIYRDLDILKMKSPSPVGEDTTKARPEWFLVEEGKKQGAQLVGLSQAPSQTISA